MDAGKAETGSGMARQNDDDRKGKGQKKRPEKLPKVPFRAQQQPRKKIKSADIPAFGKQEFKRNEGGAGSDGGDDNPTEM